MVYLLALKSVFNQTYNIFITLYALASRKLIEKSSDQPQKHIRFSTLYLLPSLTTIMYTCFLTKFIPKYLSLKSYWTFSTHTLSLSSPLLAYSPSSHHSLLPLKHKTCFHFRLLQLSVCCLSFPFVHMATCLAPSLPFNSLKSQPIKKILFDIL